MYGGMLLSHHPLLVTAHKVNTSLSFNGSSNVCGTKFGEVFEWQNLELICLVHLNNAVRVVDID